MAEGDKVTIPDGLVKKIWATKVFREGRKDSFFGKFIAEDGSNVVQTNKDLKRSNGDAVTFGLAMDLKGSGVVGNRETLKGKEDQLQLFDFTVNTQLVRNAVTRFDADDQKSAIDVLPIIKDVVKQWFMDWQDNTLISKLSESPTTKEMLSAASAGTEAALTANDKLTCAVISKAKRKAIMHAPKVKPLKVDGRDVFIMLVGTWGARDLKADPVWQAAQQNANVRGDKNPIFSGSLGEYDGVVLYEYERVLNSTTGASSANVVHNLLLGKQAACYAVAREMKYIEDTDDYNNVQGNGVSFYGGIEKSKFNGLDYGVINVLTGGAVE